MYSYWHIRTFGKAISDVCIRTLYGINQVNTYDSPTPLLFDQWYVPPFAVLDDSIGSIVSTLVKATTAAAVRPILSVHVLLFGSLIGSIARSFFM